MVTDRRKHSGERLLKCRNTAGFNHEYIANEFCFNRNDKFKSIQV